MKAEAPAPKPVDLTAAELAKLRAMLAQMQAEIDALKNRKPPAATTVVQQQPKPEPPKKVPGSMLFVSHDVKEECRSRGTLEYTLAPGATKVPCIVETSINSDVEGHLPPRSPRMSMTRRPADTSSFHKAVRFWGKIRARCCSTGMSGCPRSA